MPPAAAAVITPVKSNLPPARSDSPSADVSPSPSSLHFEDVLEQALAAPDEMNADMDTVPQQSTAKQAPKTAPAADDPQTAPAPQPPLVYEATEFLAPPVLVLAVEEPLDLPPPVIATPDATQDDAEEVFVKDHAAPTPADVSLSLSERMPGETRIEATVVPVAASAESPVAANPGAVEKKSFLPMGRSLAPVAGEMEAKESLPAHASTSSSMQQEQSDSSESQLGSNARQHSPQQAHKNAHSDPAIAPAAAEENVHAQTKPSPPTSALNQPHVSAAAEATRPAPPTSGISSPTAPPPQPSPREFEFAQANHQRLITAIRTQLLPRGGAMQLRLDPPQLGVLDVAVHLRDGIMSVSFGTSNEEATRLLSHSLAQLKHVLESQGVSVDKLHVQQSPRNESASNSRDDAESQQRNSQQDESSARQEQQRKEMLRRMWRRLSIGSDPLDLVA